MKKKFFIEECDKYWYTLEIRYDSIMVRVCCKARWWGKENIWRGRVDKIPYPYKTELTPPEMVAKAHDKGRKLIVKTVEKDEYYEKVKELAIDDNWFVLNRLKNNLK